MDDLRAVLDAAGSSRAVVFAAGDSGSLALVFAATHPQRVIALALFGTTARTMWAPDCPWALSRDDWLRWIDDTERRWPDSLADHVRASSPGLGDDEVKAFVRVIRLSVSPGSSLRSGGSTSRSTSGTSCRRCACRRSCCSGRITRPSQRPRHSSPRCPTRASSCCPASVRSHRLATPARSSASWTRSWPRREGAPSNLTACWLPSSSPTSSDRRRSRRSSAIGRGGRF